MERDLAGRAEGRSESDDSLGVASCDRVTAAMLGRRRAGEEVGSAVGFRVGRSSRGGARRSGAASLADRARRIFMSISTRLTLTLLVAVAAVMLVAGYAMQRKQEAALREQVQSEMRSHALTLQIALENLYRAGREDDAQRLIDALRENTRIYSIVLFDASGQVERISDPIAINEIGYPPALSSVLSTGETVETVRPYQDRRLVSLLMPIDVDGKRRGAFEITQRMKFIEADIAQARRDITLTTLLLFVAVAAVVFGVTRRSLDRPINELLVGASAVGRGDLSYRVGVSRTGSEIERLASEFNRMADGLEEQRRAAEQATEERLALERELRLKERLAILGRLAASVAHELGAPLNVIDWRAGQLLAQPDVAPEKKRRNLTIIQTQAARIARIVRDLLDLTRSREVNTAPANLGEIVDCTLEHLEPAIAASSVRVTVEGRRETTVEADRELIEQVLVNLVQNALHAMPEGGRLRVEIDDTSDGSGLAVVRVTDSGRGISPDHLDQVFEPFFTTKDIGDGTGLGLTISRGIVEQHGGRIEATSGPEGSTFAVYLPQAAATAAAVRTRRAVNE
jgi:two-component system, NtrC family, sensor kinase